VCARIGLVISVNLTTTLQKHYFKTLPYNIMLFCISAFILIIGTDKAGMSAVSHLLVPAVKPMVFICIFTVILLALIILFPFMKNYGCFKIGITLQLS